tara:strand:- start:7408 stop:7821 length:414 start_codon:yes stop_codon:yes gene_type:complete
MNLIKINLIKYISDTYKDIWSKNDIKIKILYGNYILETKILTNNNNPIINEEFILKYILNEPLTIIVYETENLFGDIELYKIKIEYFKNKEYICNDLRFIYEIIYDNTEYLILKNSFDKLFNNICFSKIDKIKNIII